MPHTEESFLARPLLLLTRLVLRFPGMFLAGGVALAAISAMLSVTSLGFHTSRVDLINPESDFNKLWLRYIEEFGEEDDVVVMVEGPSREAILPVLDELAETINAEEQFFQNVFYKVDLEAVRGKGLHYLSSEELDDIEKSLQQIEPVLGGEWAQLNIAALLSSPPNSADTSSAAERSAQMLRFTSSLTNALVAPDKYLSPWANDNRELAEIAQIKTEYLLANEGRWGFVLLALKPKAGSFTGGTEAIDLLRSLTSDAQARHETHGVKIGITGLPVMENDEMRASQADMTNSTLLSLVGVAAIFMAGLGGVRHPIMSVIALIIAMAWSFGFITVSIGHLNILSMSFAVILIGLGIDFGIHYIAKYLQLRQQSLGVEDALLETARSVGPGIIVGAVTTALAFMTSSLTEFTGVAELGIVAGSSVLICLIGALLLIPAMIRCTDAYRETSIAPSPLNVNHWLWPVGQYPWTSLAVMFGLTFVIALGVRQLRFDNNLMNLQPEGLESVELEMKLLTESDQSVWYALSMADSREELLKRKERFMALDTVDRTEEIVSMLPTNVESKRPIIERLAAKLENLPSDPPLIPVVPPQQLTQLLEGLIWSLPEDSPEFREAREQLQAAQNQVNTLPASEVYARLSRFQQRMAAELLAKLKMLQSISSPRPPSFDDLPASLVSRFVGKSKQHLLKIYGKGNIWDMEALERFVLDVKSVDAEATGQPLQAYYASHQMQESYFHAGCYALIAVATVLMLDFRSVRMTLLAMLPVGIGMLQTFGLMGLFNIPLNPANLIVLPLILGIGVDDGVHIVHDFRRHKHGPFRLSPATANAVLLTSLTTMVGFGSLMWAHHQGLQTLGRVVTIGVTCCLVNSAMVLPAILAIATRNRPGADEGSTTETAVGGPLPGELSGNVATENSGGEGIKPRRRVA